MTSTTATAMARAPSRRSLSTATKLNVAGLMTVAVGIVIQIAAGVDYPIVPPGLIILAVTVGLVAFTEWRWAPRIGLAVPLFLLVGGTIAASVTEDNPARHPGDIGPFTGTVVQLVGIAVAAFAGMQALRKARA